MTKTALAGFIMIKLNSTQSYPVKLYLGRVALSTFG